MLNYKTIVDTATKYNKLTYLKILGLYSWWKMACWHSKQQGLFSNLFNGQGHSCCFYTI